MKTALLPRAVKPQNHTNKGEILMNNSLIIGFGSKADPHRLPLACLNRDEIQNAQRLEDSPERRIEAIKLWKNLRPNARLRSISGRYNCMGMVFASRRTVIDVEELPKILRGDGYARVTKTGNYMEGDIVVYRTKSGKYSHVGVIMFSKVDVKCGNVTWFVLSKWGTDGEYFHEIDYVPQIFGDDYEVWTERKSA